MNAIIKSLGEIRTQAHADRVASGGSFDVYFLMIVYRLGHRLVASKPIPIVSKTTLTILERLRKIHVYSLNVDIPFTASIQPGIRLPHPMNIVVSGDCRIGAGVTIFHGVTLGRSESLSRPDGAPTLGPGAAIGANATIVGPVTVGANASVGAGAVVTRDVPPGAVVVGHNRLVSQ